MNLSRFKWGQRQWISAAGASNCATAIIWTYYTDTIINRGQNLGQWNPNFRTKHWRVPAENPLVRIRDCNCGRSCAIQSAYKCCLHTWFGYWKKHSCSTIVYKHCHFELKKHQFRRSWESHTQRSRGEWGCDKRTNLCFKRFHRNTILIEHFALGSKNTTVEQ